MLINIVLLMFLPFDSGDGQYAVMGLEDGSVRVQPLVSDDVGLMGAYWSLPVHDTQYGPITHVTLSHDHTFLFTVGADGNFFAFKFMDQEEVAAAVAQAKAKIPSARVRIGRNSAFKRNVFE